MSLPPVPSRRGSLASIEDLDDAIQRLACHVNAVSYRMLLLVREFDDRFGWGKWGFSSCAEWLQWRIGISLSAAREKVRVAHALRDLPAISAAFEKGRLSYSKVRGLTRAADASNEQSLLEFALGATAAQVEERCQQIRNVHPNSAEEAKHAWARRTLSVFRNPSRHVMTISAELPLEAGELLVRALEKAVQSGDAASGPEFGGEGWHAQQADGIITMARAYLAGCAAGCAAGCTAGEAAGEAAGEHAASADGHRSQVSRSSVSADHYQVVVHVDEAALPSGARHRTLVADARRQHPLYAEESLS